MHACDSRGSGYRLDRQGMRGEAHGNPLLIAPLYSDIEVRPSAETAEEEKDGDLKREESVE